MNKAEKYDVSQFESCHTAKLLSYDLQTDVRGYS